MTLKLNRDLDILKMYLHAEDEVAKSSHSKYEKKYENNLQGVRSRSNITNFQSLLAITIVHIPAKLHQFLIISFRDFVQTDAQTPPNTPLCRSIASAHQ